MTYTIPLAPIEAKTLGDTRRSGVGISFSGAHAALITMLMHPVIMPSFLALQARMAVRIGYNSNST